MIAKKENEYFVLYNEENSIIGKIRFQNKEEIEITVNEENITYQVIKNNWNFEVRNQNELVCNLKMNSFWGDINVIELNKRIKGVFSMKWGTQMVDENNKTLLKIKNENLLIDKGIYEIEISDNQITDFEILLSLFGHLYGSNMKLLTVVVNS
jgi:hypothetical protein